ncbi:MAG TPA: type II toxin-antitoxin system HicA family toxin [Negativicutes bacterium]|nr:type II toxin-antitoxin system HicA family toxin [Negativicutes bacterium]
MTNWPSVRAKHVFAALLKIGWQVKRQSGSHVVLEKEGCQNYVWAFRDYEEIGPRMLARIAKKTGLKPEDI